MTRTRRAIALGVVALVAVAATAALGAAAPETIVVTDPGSGATFEVPAADWTAQEPDERISYGDAWVLGPALRDEGYCRARPQGSFRALAGFTDQSFDAWVSGVTGGGSAWSTGPSTEEIVLADGTAATYRWEGLFTSATGPCASSGVEVAMVRAGDVRAVVVADSGDEGTLSHDRVREILVALQLP
jgi:hypothetical protein